MLKTTENGYSYHWWRARCFSYGGMYFDSNMKALARRKSPKEPLDSAADEWDKITDRRGRDKQKAPWGERLHEMKQVGIEHHPEWAAKAK